MRGTSVAIIGTWLLALLGAAPPIPGPTPPVRTVSALGYPADFDPHGVAPVSATDFFVYGNLGASSEERDDVVLRTVDGGRSFRRVGSPPLPRSGALEASVAALWFSSPKVGYALEYLGYVNIPSLLYVTSDEGQHWRQAYLPASNIVSFQTAQGRAYALVADCSRFNPCTGWRLGVQDARGLTWAWSKVALPEAAWDSAEITLPGYGGLLYYSAARGKLDVARFSVGLGLSRWWAPSGLTGACWLQATTTGPVVWARCDTGNGSVVARSPDGGHEFSTLGRFRGNANYLAPMSATTAVFTGAAGVISVGVSDHGPVVRNVTPSTVTGGAGPLFSSPGSPLCFTIYADEARLSALPGLFETINLGASWSRFA